MNFVLRPASHMTSGGGLGQNTRMHNHPRNTTVIGHNTRNTVLDADASRFQPHILAMERTQLNSNGMCIDVREKIRDNAASFSSFGSTTAAHNAKRYTCDPRIGTW